MFSHRADWPTCLCICLATEADWPTCLCMCLTTEADWPTCLCMCLTTEADWPTCLCMCLATEADWPTCLCMCLTTEAESVEQQRKFACGTVLVHRPQCPFPSKHPTGSCLLVYFAHSTQSFQSSFDHLIRSIWKTLFPSTRPHPHPHPLLFIISWSLRS